MDSNSTSTAYYVPLGYELAALHFSLLCDGSNTQLTGVLPVLTGHGAREGFDKGPQVLLLADMCKL